MTTIFRLPSNTTQSISSETSINLSSRNKKKRQRGPRYSRINEKSQSLLTRLLGTIFGDYKFRTNKKTRTKNSSLLLPSQSTIEKQFNENEQTLQSFVTLLTQIESTKNLSNENEQARNNNRIEET